MRLLLAMADTRTHASFFAPDFSSTLPGLLYTHESYLPTECFSDFNSICIVIVTRVLRSKNPGNVSRSVSQAQ